MKNDFPFLNNSDVVYLDSAATSQKPNIVIDSMNDYYKNYNSNANRGSYKSSVKSSELYDNARLKVSEFINSNSKNQIIFTKNATEASNLIAYSYGLNNLNEDDEIVLSIMEHHANIVPWQFVCETKKCKLNYMYLNNEYEISKEEIVSKINEKTKLVCITHISNVLGTVNDIEFIIKHAHKFGAKVIVDASQSIAHTKINVQKLDVDFLFFSAHKMMGPTGIGVLYAKEDILNNMKPFILGGDMIEYVYEDRTTFAPLPNKFEAGTQNVAGAIGLQSAIEYIESIGFDKIQKIDNELVNYAIDKLSELNFIDLYIPKNNHSSIISFNVKNIHSHDVATILDNKNVSIRVGNHCAQPLIRFLKLESTCRLSLYLYNTKEDIDKLIEALYDVYNLFSKIIDKEL